MMMKEKVGEVFSIAMDNPAIPGCTISKAVHPDGLIERCENVKEVALYLEKIEEMIERKRKLLGEAQ